MLGNFIMIAVSFVAGMIFTVIIFRHDIFQVSDWDGTMPDLEDVFDDDCHPKEQGPGPGGAQKGR